MTPRLRVDARARLGECTLWCDSARSLYWTDIESATLSRWEMESDRVRCWRLPDRVGSFALCQDSDILLLGLASGIALFDLRSERLVTPVIPVEPDLPTTRINDGRCDRQGRFVFGMFNKAEAAIGHFYRVDAHLRIERLALPSAAVANSIAWSPDGGTLYYADSPTRIIFCAPYGVDGSIGDSRPFARLGPEEGFPDGSAVDAEGGLWNAQWRGGCVVRYDTKGVPMLRIALPVSQPTCAAFGGPGLDRLFVSSARAGLSDAALEREPLAGGVFEIDAGWRGVPEPRFIYAGHG